MRRSLRQSSALALVLLAGFAVPAQADEDLSRLDLAALMQMDVEVTTASKSAQSIYEVAAPIHVITDEAIRRAGASSIPEALRLAPGVMVGQIDPGKWVVSLRGFAWEFANKALILLDGRAVYSPLNSSVYWSSLDVPMEDIERIEVIRGPGDARWGSHAVNGIINIITRHASDTHGASLSAQLDTNASEILTARYGGNVLERVDYRVYANYLSQGDFPMSSDFPRIGDRTALRAGVRLDGKSRGGDQFTFIGDVQNGRDTSILPGQNFNPARYDTNEWSTLTRWERGSASGVRQQAQLSFDRLSQELSEDRKTLDFAYQAQLPEIHGQALTFGATYKRSSDLLPATIGIEPAELALQTYGAFLHDRIALGAHTRLLLGSQFEHNAFTGWEVQPNLQVLYTPRERRTFWASVSRAVRAPLRTEDGFNLEFQIAPALFGRAVGNHNLQAETVVAWQAGWREALRDDVFVDVAVFLNRYQDLVIQQAGVPTFDPDPPPGRTIVPAIYANAAAAKTRGIEAGLQAQPVTQWNVAFSASLYSQTRLSDPLGFGSVTAVEQQYQFHSSTTLVRSVEWNLDVYYTGALLNVDVPEYYKVDTQLAWTPRKNLRLALGVRNAFDRSHEEAGGNSVDAVARIPRVAYFSLLGQF